MTMDGQTRDDLGARVQAAFRSSELPGAPASLRDRLEQIPDLPVERDGAARAGGRAPGRSTFGILGLAAVLAVGGALALATGGRQPAPPVPPPPSGTVVAEGSASPAPSAPLARRLTYALQWSAAVPADPAVLARVVEIVQERLDGDSAPGAIVRSVGPDRIQVDLPADLDLERLRPLIGRRGEVAFVPLGDIAKVKGDPIDPAAFPPLFGNAEIAGAVASASTQTGDPVVQIQLTPEGDRLFGDWTAAHVGTYFAIAVDGIAVAVPVINSEIRGGTIDLTQAPAGVDAAADLAAAIRSEALPVPIVEVASEALPIDPTTSLSTEPPIADDDPRIQCEPPLDVEGPQLECMAAIRSALAILPAGHPPIVGISFFHECNDVGFSTADCLVQAFGLVTFRFADGSPAVRVSLSIGSTPVILPNR